MGSLGEAVLDLTADASKLDPGLSEGKGKVTGALDGLKGTFSTATGTMLGQLSAGALRGLGQGIISVGKDITGAALDAEQAQAQLNAVLESTGGAAGMSADEINKLANAYSSLTMFDDEAIVGAESMLLTFTNVGEDVFPTATQAILDMSQALGQDLNSSAMQLGKALNDPIQGVTALRRVGVQLTDDQEKLIKKLVETGDVAGAQRIILAELNKEFGGSAEAAGQTMAGQLAILNTEFENVKEEAGTAFLPVLKELVVVAKQFMPYLQQAIQWFSSLPGPVKTGVVALLGLVAVLAPLIGIISTIISVVSVLGPAFAAIGSAVAAIGAALAPLTIPILAVIAAVALLYLAWKTNFFGIRDTLTTVWEAIKLVFAAFKAAFAGDWRGFGELLRQAWDLVWNLIVARIQSALTAAVNIAKAIVNGIKAAFKINWIELGKNIIDGILTGLKNGIGAVIEMAKKVAKAALDAAKGFLLIKSPSAAFAELGKFSGMGFAQGLQGSLTPQMVTGTLGRVMGGTSETMNRVNHTNVTINNPVAEPASRSVDKTLKNLSYLGVIK